MITIALLSSNRHDLLRATVSSLLETVTVKNFKMVIVNHDGSIGEGWNRLIDEINTPYVLMCQEDWFFMERFDWIEQSMRALSLPSHKDLGIIRLRKDQDGQCGERTLTTVDCIDYVDCLGGGFTLNPFITKRQTLDALGKVSSIQMEKGAAELELRERYSKFEYKTGKLNLNPGRGVCIHIGRGRRILGKET